MPFVAAWIGAFARRLDFHVADEHVSQRDRVIGSSLERGQRRFADRREPVSFEAAELREIREEPFQRGAKLVLGLAGRAWICELRFRLGAKSGNRRFSKSSIIAPIAARFYRIINKHHQTAICRMISLFSIKLESQAARL